MVLDQLNVLLRDVRSIVARNADWKDLRYLWTL